MKENASVQAIRSKQDDEWWDGVLRGYHSTGSSPWWRNTPVAFLGTKERGELFGILLKENERHYRDGQTLQTNTVSIQEAKE